MFFGNFFGNYLQELSNHMIFSKNDIENVSFQVEPEICALTPEIVAQAPEAEDKFAGAPGVDPDWAEGEISKPQDMTNLGG